jgi:hypothetical protein
VWDNFQLVGLVSMALSAQTAQMVSQTSIVIRQQRAQDATLDFMRQPRK